MTLREKQSLFAKNVAKLITWCYDNGYEITLGEAMRSLDQQRLYFEGYTLLKIGGNLKMAKIRPKSKTMNSSHLEKLAIDLNLFIDGKYQTEKESYKPIAEFWKSLNENNIAGYDWGWDANHFEMKL